MPSYAKEVTDGLPTLPDSLRQSIANPTQDERLPDTSRMTLRFPVVDTPGYHHNRTIATLFTYFAIFLLVWFGNSMLFITSNPLVFAWGMGHYLSFLSALLYVWFFYIDSWYRWLALCAAVVASAFALTVQEPYLLFIGGSLAIAALADRIGTHNFLIETCAPMPAAEARRKRKAWGRRFWSFGEIEGAEFYPLLVFIAPLAAVGLFYWELQSAAYSWEINAYRCLALLVGMATAVVALEYLAALTWKRPARGWRLLWSAARLALKDWMTYDRGNSQSPGVHKTPFGGCRVRWGLAMTVVLISSSYTTTAFFPGLLNTPSGRMDRPIRAELRTLFGERSYPLSWQTPKEIIEEALLQMREANPFASPEQIELTKELAEERYQQRMTVNDQVKNKIEGLGYDKRLTTSLNIGATLLLLFCLPLMAVVVAFGHALIGGLAASAPLAGREARFEGNELVKPEDWRNIVDQLRSSPDPVERESLFLGVNAADNAPILVPRRVFKEHAHILGDTGTGKTSIGIPTIISQLLEMGECSVVVLDLKGDDHALFEQVRCDSEQAGNPFRWFANTLGEPTYGFNPLTQNYLKGLPSSLKADILTNAMGLQYGRDYGRAFYADANSELLARAFSEQPEVETFRELERILEKGPRQAGKELMKNSSHVRSSVKQLADSDALNLSRQDTERPEAVAASIDFGDMFRTPQTVYMHLSTGYGAGTSAEIARLALFSLLHGAYAVSGERVPCYVVIDEFQRIISQNLSTIMQLARSLNISIILANQTMSDLQEGAVNLIPAISANTRFRQVFGASYTKDLEELSRASGETISHQGSWVQTVLSGSLLSALNISEQIMPRQRINDLLLATDKDGRSLMQLRRGEGYAQFGGLSLVMQSGYTISPELYNERRLAPWPEPTEETLPASHRERDYDGEQEKLPPLGKPRRDLFIDDEPTGDSPAGTAATGQDLLGGLGEPGFSPHPPLDTTPDEEPT